MIVDFEKDAFPQSQQFHVCIVGSGAAGLTLAHQLLDRGYRILLLEGGGNTRWERRSQALNKTTNLGQQFAGAHSGRFRGLGGTTSAWAGQVMELDDLDFEPRSWVEGSGWPISKAELARYYVEARELERTAQLAHDDAEVWASIGKQEPILSADLRLSFSRYCPDARFARVFSDTIAHERLTLVLHANVVEMAPTEDRRKIAALKVRTLKGKEAWCKASQVVLCLGGIESSRFLLNQPFAPWNQSGLVGRFFQDHIHCFAADIRRANINVRHWPYGPWRINGQYLPKIKVTSAAQKENRLLNVSGMIEYSDGVFETIRTGIKVVAGPTTAVGLKEFARMAPRVPAALWYKLKSRKNPNYVVPWAQLKLSVWCEQSPRSASRITLSSQKDSLGLKRANVSWIVSPLEVDSIRKYTQMVKDVFLEKGIAEVIPAKDLYSDEIYSRCSDQFHHCGGTRMSKVPQDGVVDQNLRLHGLENAYVCSSSVFPSSGFANPTHTVIALAARLAHRLDGLLTRTPSIT